LETGGQGSRIFNFHIFGDHVLAHPFMPGVREGNRCDMVIWSYDMISIIEMADELSGKILLSFVY
jgi:hypothetical protein